jgi:hypothetical protein
VGEVLAYELGRLARADVDTLLATRADRFG